VTEQILACVSRQGCQPVFTKKPDLLTKQATLSHKKSQT